MSDGLVTSTVPPIRIAAERSRQPLGLIIAAASLAGVFAVGLLHLDRLPISMCALKFATGCPCPTCGTTRAFGRLFARDWAGAVAMNPLAVFAALLVGLWGLADLALLPMGRALSVSLSPRSARVCRWAALALILANWFYLIAAGR
jgi:Protein of unknown function (DUF2752)